MGISQGHHGRFYLYPGCVIFFSNVTNTLDGITIRYLHHDGRRESSSVSDDTINDFISSTIPAERGIQTIANINDKRTKK